MRFLPLFVPDLAYVLFATKRLRLIKNHLLYYPLYRRFDSGSLTNLNDFKGFLRLLPLGINLKTPKSVIFHRYVNRSDEKSQIFEKT